MEKQQRNGAVSVYSYGWSCVRAVIRAKPPTLYGATCISRNGNETTEFPSKETGQAEQNEDTAGLSQLR